MDGPGSRLVGVSNVPWSPAVVMPGLMQPVSLMSAPCPNNKNVLVPSSHNLLRIQAVARRWSKSILFYFLVKPGM